MSVPLSVTLKYASYLVTLTGREEERLTLPRGTSLYGLFTTLAAKYGPDLVGYFLSPETGDLWPGVAVVLNNHLLASLKGTPPLTDGDEILLLPAAEGG